MHHLLHQTRRLIAHERGFASHTGRRSRHSLAAAGGGIVGGLASDRFGRLAVLRSSVLLSIPLFIGLVYSTPDQWWYYPLTALVGAMVTANTPVAIVTAQEYAPNHVATASALMMGFAWGTSGVLFTLVGALADLTSPRTAMVAAILPFCLRSVTMTAPDPASALPRMSLVNRSRGSRGGRDDPLVKARPSHRP